MKQVIFILLLLNLYMLTFAQTLSTARNSDASLTEVQPENFFPLSKGSYWIYKGVKKWQEETKISEKTLTWKMEVIEAINRQSTIIAILKGHPGDLAWGESRGDYLIIRAGPKFYLIDDQEYGKVLERLAYNGELYINDFLDENDLFLDLPLTSGKRFGDPEQINRPDNSYCWFIEAKDQVELKNVKGISPPGKMTRYRLIFRTGPDHTAIEYVPGVGIIRYIYSHHGTISEVDLKLIEYQKGQISSVPEKSGNLNQFNTGDRMKVLPNNGLKLRSSYQIKTDNNNKIGLMPKDTIVTILSHPDNGIMADNYYWYYVQHDSQQGWCAMANYQENEIYLNPVKMVENLVGLIIPMVTDSIFYPIVYYDKGTYKNPEKQELARLNKFFVNDYQGNYIGKFTSAGIYEGYDFTFPDYYQGINPLNYNYDVPISKGNLNLVEDVNKNADILKKAFLASVLSNNSKVFAYEAKNNVNFLRQEALSVARQVYSKFNLAGRMLLGKDVSIKNFYVYDLDLDEIPEVILDVSVKLAKPEYFEIWEEINEIDSLFIAKMPANGKPIILYRGGEQGIEGFIGILDIDGNEIAEVITLTSYGESHAFDIYQLKKLTSEQVLYRVHRGKIDMGIYEWQEQAKAPTQAVQAVAAEKPETVPAKPSDEVVKPAKAISRDGAVAIIEMVKGGRIVMEFYTQDAPNTVRNFVKLANKGFYNGLKFHRVVNDPGGLQIIQGGDPLGNGTGGPGYTIKAEFNSQKHLTGTVAMARSDNPDSAGSQFYICLAPQPFLDKNYTVFGQVIEGIEVANSVKEGDVMKKVTIVDKASLKK